MIQVQYVLCSYEKLNAAADLPGGRAQVVIFIGGRGCRYR